MADKKITQLDALTVADYDDALPIVDLSGPITKRISFGNMFAAPAAIGINIPDSGNFTALTSNNITLTSGATISAFTIDQTLSGNSDTNVPTEKAVKTYVDTQISDLNPNKIWQLDSRVEVLDDGTNAGYVQIIADGQQVAYFDALATSVRIGKSTDDKARLVVTDDKLNIYGPIPVDQFEIGYPSMRMGLDGEQRLHISGSTLILGKPEANQHIIIDSTTGIEAFTGLSIMSLTANDQRLGRPTGTRVALNSTSASIYAGASLEAVFNSFGLSLTTGITLVNPITEFSTDGTFAGDSDLALPTEKAVKTYVDTAIASIVVNVNKIYQGVTSAEAFDNTSFAGIVFKTRDLVLGDSSGTIVTTFRYNAYATSNWTNPQNMVDGSLLTYASTGSATGTYIQKNNHNTTSDSTAVGTITKVELRIYSNTGGPSITEMYLYPMFNGSTVGDAIDFYGVNGWSTYFDITHDSQAPLDWTWDDVRNLSTRVVASISDSTSFVRVRQIEIKVTYSNQTLVEGSKAVANFDKAGLILEYGARINKFSTDGTLVGNSDTSVPTERAIKTYIDSIVDHLDIMTVKSVTQDSTALSGEAIIVDATGDIVLHVVPKIDGKYVIKNATNHRVTIIPTFGSIEFQSLYVIGTYLKSVTMISNGANLFII